MTPKKRDMQVFKLPHEQVTVSKSMATHAICDPGTTAYLLQAFDEICETCEGSGKNYLTFRLYSQLQYTAGMVIDKGGYDIDERLDTLEEAGGEDQAVVDRVVFENIQHALHDPSRTVKWEQLANALPIEGDDRDSLVAAYNKIDDWLVEEDHLVVNIPSDDPRDFLACYPNGYFSGDLGVFHNAAVIERMTKQHGAQFLGMGSSTLVFRTRSSVTATEVEKIIDDITYIYGLPDHPEREKMRATIMETGVVVIFYVCDF